LRNCSRVARMHRGELATRTALATPFAALGVSLRGPPILESGGCEDR